MGRVLKALLLLVVILAWSVPAMAEGPVVLKFATIEPPQSYIMKHVFAPYFDQINKEGKGVLEVKIFPGGTLGRNPNQQLDILLNGVCDIVHIINGYLQSGRLADDQVTQTPFLAKNCMECTLAAQYMQQKKVLNGYDDLKILGQVCLGVYGIHSTFPVKVPADLKGKKIRTAGKMYQGMSKALGATPVDMPVTKVAEAMSRGVVQVTLQDWMGMTIFRINDVAPYHLMVPLGPNFLTVAMTKKKYESLPPKAKALIDKYLGVRFSNFWGEKLQAQLKTIQAKMMEDKKHHVTIPTPEQLAQWEAVLNPLVADWEKEMPKYPLLLKTYKEGLAQAREAMKKQ